MSKKPTAEEIEAEQWPIESIEAEVYNQKGTQVRECMKVKANLFIDNSGNIRVTKRDTSAYPRELAVQLVLDIPDIFFRRPIPRVDLSIPPEYLIDPDQRVVAHWAGEDVAAALKLDVKTVEDGLLTMLKEKQAKEHTEVQAL